MYLATKFCSTKLFSQAILQVATVFVRTTVNGLAKGVCLVELYLLKKKVVVGCEKSSVNCELRKS